MLPLLAAVSAGAELVKLVPGLFKLFGDNPPPVIIDRAVAIANAVTGTATPEAALEKIQADPEVALQYKDAAEKRALELTQAYLADIQSARSRDTEIQRIKGSNKRADILAAAALLGVIVCLIIVVVISDLNETAKVSISLILGRCLGWVEQVFSFEYGTTKSSKSKDDTINELSKP